MTQTPSRGREALMGHLGTPHPWEWVSSGLSARGVWDWLGPLRGPLAATLNPHCSPCQGFGGRVREGVALRVEAGES